MKHLKDILNQNIHEGLKLGSSKINQYTEHPKSKQELIDILKERLKKDHDADLNDIDVSAITNMSNLFAGLDPHNIKIDQWDVSNVNTMFGMFWECYNFNGDLSKWYTPKVKSMSAMFWKCNNFNSDLSKWDVSSCNVFEYMFLNCRKFDCDLNKWKVNKKAKIYGMFDETELEDHPPKWFHK